MPTYEFENEAGQRIERMFAISEAPQELVEDGVRFKRAISVPLVAFPRDVTHVSDQLPLHWKHAPDHDEQGRCRFRSQHEIDETIARARGAGEHVTFNDALDNYGKDRPRVHYAAGVGDTGTASGDRESGA